MELVPGIHQVDGIKGAHAYLLLLPKLTLVDTGLPGQEQGFINYLQALGHRPEDLKYIVLTHYDIDHVGSAAALKKVTGARVCAGADEVPYIEGNRRRPGIKRFLPGLVSPVYGKLDPIQVDDALADGVSFNGLGILGTPGHTPGHMCVTLGKNVIVGDLLQGGLKEAPGIFIWNKQLARQSIRKLAGLKPSALFPGHGSPDFDPRDRLQELIGSW